MSHLTYSINAEEKWIVTIVSLALAYLTIRIIQWIVGVGLKTNKNKNTSIPKVPNKYPIIGNTLGPDGALNLSKQLESWASQYSSSCKEDDEGFLECTLFGTKYVILCNKNALDFVASHRPNKIHRTKKIREVVNGMAGKGVFTAEGSVWRHERRLFGPPLNRNSLNHYVGNIRMVAHRLVRKWERLSSSSSSSEKKTTAKEEGFPIQHDLIGYALDNIGLLAFGIDYNSLEHDYVKEANDIHALCSVVVWRALAPIPYWKIPIIGTYLDGAGYAVDRLKRHFMELIQEHQQQHDNNDQNQSQQQQRQQQNIQNKKSTTFLAKIIELSKKEEINNHRKMTNDRLVGNLLTMFIAGTETTSITITSCLWELVHDPSLMKELTVEAQSMTNFDTASIEEIFQSLPKLRSLFYEVVRLRGPSSIIALENTVSLRTKNNTVFPKGTQMFAMLKFVGKNCNDGGGVPIGPKGEPHSIFCPRRWLVSNRNEHHNDDNNNNNIDVTMKVMKPSAKNGIPYSTGFGFGARICPGQDLSELESLICLALLLRTFDITIGKNHSPIRWVTNLVEGPDKPIRLCFERKTHTK